MVDEARQWFVEVSPPSADEEGGEHAIVDPSGTVRTTWVSVLIPRASNMGVLLIAHKLVISE